ncbi:hypothetical protein JVT61DRAFT_293 [Boletus reticuloceps]|uniref:Uncharacterized protein n=1 Tax=Boletus reticuloceps TaxID=495285 RepID=A0A8I2Z2X4_9AGAM|nr:hypothetical protein JVT61DRAFT_293 [Boletus reticuloceps]
MFRSNSLICPFLNVIGRKTVYESVFALILGTLGASLNAPPLKDITWASEMKKRWVLSNVSELQVFITPSRTIDEMDSRLGFANYHSRGKSFLVPSPPERSCH